MPSMTSALRASEPVLAATAFLTREDGKNAKLRKLLDASGVSSEELPCIAFQRLPGFEELRDAIADLDSSS